MEPLREDFEEAFLRGSHNISVPVLLINSEEFTLWKDHMGRQQRLMQQGARQGVKEYAFFTMGLFFYYIYRGFVLIFSLSWSSSYGIL